jgi:hypothetical protein
VATKGSGVFILDINLLTYETKREDHVYLQGKYITDLCELSEGLILAASYSDCSYYVLNLKEHSESFLCKGFSPYAMGLTKLPAYAYAGEDEFPYVLAKEDDYLTVIHVRAGFALRLVNVPTHNQNHFNQRLAWVSDSTFITDEGSYFLAKYRLTDVLFKYLRDVNAWAKVKGLVKY